MVDLLYFLMVGREQQSSFSTGAAVLDAHLQISTFEYCALHSRCSFFYLSEKQPVFRFGRCFAKTGITQCMRILERTFSLSSIFD